MKLAAVGDIHSPKYLDLFKDAVSRAPSDVKCLILCGDLILKGRHEEVSTVVQILKSKYSCPIYACFGNEEYESVEDKIVESTKNEVTWLDDSLIEVELSGYKVTLIGTRGCLDRPTRWQMKNIPNAMDIYNQRVKRLDELLSKSSGKVVLFSHYAPTYLTLEGEQQRIWPELGCKKLENLILKRQPDLVIHAHAHRATRLEASLGLSKVINASLPASGKITVAELPEAGRKALKVTLEHFM